MSCKKQKGGHKLLSFHSSQKNILKKIMVNVNKDDYECFSKEFICLIESNTIKEYYSIIKYKYNYIRFTIFKQNVSIRYRENRYKLYKNDDI